MKIIWQKPDSTIAITFLTRQLVDALERLSLLAICITPATEALAEQECAGGDVDDEALAQQRLAVSSAKGLVALRADLMQLLGGTSLQHYGALLQGRGDVPPDWILKVVGTVDLPADWERQEDWRLVDGAVVVDLNCARETTRERLRMERAPLLAALDVEFQRNLETGADNRDVVAKKNRLRDITKWTDGCKTLADLKVLSAASVDASA